MRFGLMIASQWLPEEDMTTKITEALEQVRAAREAGFDLIAAGQHYLSYPYQHPATVPFLARMASEAQGMHIAATVLLLPILPPVDVAESVATLDAISGGKFILGVGLGYRKEENIAFGIAPKERVPRLLESLEVMKRLWTEDEVEFHGSFYTIPAMKRLGTRPVQQPYPPIWMGAHVDQAVRRAARLGYPWLITPHNTISGLESQVRLYKETLKEGGAKDMNDLPIMRDMYLCTDSNSALEQARLYLEPKYKAYLAWDPDDKLGRKEAFRLPFEELAKGRFLIGTPEEIIQEVELYQQRLGVSHMLFRMQWPGMPHRDAMRMIELFGQHVMPYFRQRSRSGA